MTVSSQTDRSSLEETENDLNPPDGKKTILRIDEKELRQSEFLYYYDIRKLERML